MIIKVNTPKGEKYHGEIKNGNFYREVDYWKDRLIKWNSWSIHPDALEIIKREKVKNLIYKTDKDTFCISLEEAIKYGFEGNLGGGRTIYIPLKHWVKMKAGEEQQMNLI